MEFNKAVADMEPGDQIEGFYLLKEASIKNTVAGKPFLCATVMDVTGSIDAKMWDYGGPFGPKDTGRVIKIRGEVSEYRGARQLTIQRMRGTEPGDVYDSADLVPAAPISRSETEQFVRDVIASVEDREYREVCERMLERHLASFTVIPAAKSVHHSFLNGLLMHTANMLRSAQFLADLYPEVIDRSLLLTGTLLHDFAKEQEFAVSELGLVTDYSVKGQLLGHLVMGAREAAEVAEEIGMDDEKSMLLQHMILSHHGEPEYGAAVKPACAEAELLSLIDLIDSRMEIYTEALAEVQDGEFTQKLFALDKRIYRHSLPDSREGR